MKGRRSPLLFLRDKLRRFVLLVPPLTFLLVFVIGAIVFMVLYVGTGNVGQAFLKLIEDGGFQSAYLRTLRMAVVVAVSCSVMAYPTAFYALHLPQRMRSLVRSLIFLPVMINPIVRGYGWMIILGRKGMVNSILSGLGLVDSPIKLLYTELAAEVGLIELFLPFMFIPLLGAMENINEEVILAARSLGAGTLRVFTDIVMPLSVKGYLLGLVTVLAGGFSAFVTPSLLGGMRNRTLSMLIYEFIELRLNWSAAAAIALVIMTTVLTVTWLVGMLIKRRR